MKFGAYLKDKAAVIFSTVFIIAMVYLMGYVFKADRQYMSALAFLIIIFTVSILIAGFYKRYRFYKEVFAILDKLDQKYLVTEMMLTPDFPEGVLLMEVLYDVDKSMKERVNRMEASVAEFKDYLEMWIHEIKIPIAGLRLMNYNRSIDPVKLKNQIDRLNYYVEQILFYARADAPEKDYLLNKCSLESAINKVVMEQKDMLIGNKISIIKQNTGHEVITDSKWLEFMIGQIVSNSIKYADMEGQPYIKFYVEKEENDTVLYVEDNGIGIDEKDVPRVFEKTFTGENGRKGSVSTGMGLYICKKLCDKLGHKLDIESVRGEYTRLSVTFGNNSFYQM